MPEETNYNHHMSYEQHLENEHQRIQEQLQSDYRLYCSKFNEMYPNHKPLSYNVWMHTDTSNIDAHKFDDLPF
jgi:hypothetical protein